MDTKQTNSVNSLHVASTSDPNSLSVPHWARSPPGCVCHLSAVPPWFTQDTGKAQHHRVRLERKPRFGVVEQAASDVQVHSPEGRRIASASVEILSGMAPWSPQIPRRGGGTRAAGWADDEAWHHITTRLDLGINFKGFITKFSAANGARGRVLGLEPPKRRQRGIADRGEVAKTGGGGARRSFHPGLMSTQHKHQSAFFVIFLIFLVDWSVRMAFSFHQTPPSTTVLWHVLTDDDKASVKRPGVAGGD